MLPLKSNHWQGDVCSLPRGATLMRRAMPMDYVYHVDSGRVSLRLNEGEGHARPLPLIEVKGGGLLVRPPPALAFPCSAGEA